MTDQSKMFPQLDLSEQDVDHLTQNIKENLTQTESQSDTTALVIKVVFHALEELLLRMFNK